MEKRIDRETESRLDRLEPRMEIRLRVRPAMTDGAMAIADQVRNDRLGKSAMTDWTTTIADRARNE